VSGARPPAVRAVRPYAARLLAPELLPALLLALLLGACAGGAPPRDGPPVYPPPPAAPRFQWEAALRAPEDIGAGASGALRGLLAGRQSAEPVLQKPYAVAARGGRLYVSDTLARAVHVFDIPRRRYFTFGHREEVALGKPLGMALDRRGRLYVADASRGAVLEFDPLGLLLRRIGAGGELQRPLAVAAAADGERLYVVDNGGVDSARHGVVVFGADGAPLARWIARGDGPGEFNLPVDIARGPDGNLYLLDAGNFRVQVLAPDGRFLRQWGTVGRRPGQFARPRGIAVDHHGRVYVSDAAFGKVQIFTAEGRLLMALGDLARGDAPGRFVLAAGVAVDETGRVYLVDQLFRKLSVFRPHPAAQQ